MYNEEFKKMFLSSLEVDTKAYLVIFNNSYEESIRKDIFDFSINEIIDFLKLRNSISAMSLNVVCVYCRQYVDFALKEHMVKDGQNHFDEVTYEILQNCVNTNKLMKAVITREDLIEKVNQFINPYEKYIVLGCFEGLAKYMKDLINVKEEDIEGNRIRLISGRVLEVSPQLRAVAIEACNEYSFVSESERTFSFVKSDPCAIKSKREDSDESNKSQIIHRVIRQCRNMFGDSWTRNTLINSGIIDMIKSNKMEGETDFQCLVRIYNDVVYRYKNIRNKQKWISDYLNF